MKTTFLILIGLVFSAMSTVGQTTELPSLECKTMTGETVDIKDQIKDGQVTIVAFWASWCSPIKKELEAIAELYEDWKNAYDLELIAVSIDDARTLPKAKELVIGKQWEYTVLFAPNGEASPAFGYTSIPYTIFFDQSGNIVYTLKGYVPGDEVALEEEIKKFSKK